MFKGDDIGMIGGNGVGKRRLIKRIGEKDGKVGGEIMFGGNLEIG